MTPGIPGVKPVLVELIDTKARTRLKVATHDRRAQRLVCPVGLGEDLAYWYKCLFHMCVRGQLRVRE